MYIKRMGFYEDLIEGLNLGLKNKFEDKYLRLAKASKSHSTTVKRILSGERSKRLDLVCRMADSAGLSVKYETQPETARPVHFVRPQIVSSEELSEGPADDNHIAVPLAKRPVAAGTGIIPDDRVESWVLVWRGQFAVRHRSNLAVVRIDSRDGDSMVPTLHPDDLVLIDRNDWEPKNPPGNIYLVQTPEGDDMGLKIKRARIQRKNSQELIVFYSDNPEHGPEIYDMQTDYENDLRRAVKGRVIWSWSDMTKK